MITYINQQNLRDAKDTNSERLVDTLVPIEIEGTTATNM
jgi:hypothetical protein